LISGTARVSLPIVGVYRKYQQDWDPHALSSQVEF
jgi:hypothetical protein